MPEEGSKLVLAFLNFYWFQIVRFRQHFFLTHYIDCLDYCWPNWVAEDYSEDAVVGSGCPIVGWDSGCMDYNLCSDRWAVLD